MVLCKTAELRRRKEISSYSQSTPATELGKSCKYFNPLDVHSERVYWSKCDDCCKEAAAANPNVTEDDLFLFTYYNRLLRTDLVEQVNRRPYAELVRAFPNEFRITQRFMLSGYRWVEALQPTPTDALGPHPPMDTKLEGLQWWYEQGMCGKVHDEIAEWMGKHYDSKNPPEVYCPYNVLDRVLNWMKELPPDLDQFSEIDNRSLSDVSGASSWSDMIPSTDLQTIADEIYETSEEEDD
ncbi:hypothetical protein F5B19DRAFT_502351 [Rostrohypoxylon terebratum]|nr:hypothetical protein F5B19DRAFT_502351 [Rostrohypoxylon terebratum]